MNHMKLLSLATALALAAPLLPAEDIKEVTWNQVCRETNGHELQLTTAKGETVSGYCVGVTVDEIREVFILLTLYAGIPASIEAHRIAMEVMQELELH